MSGLTLTDQIFRVASRFIWNPRRFAVRRQCTRARAWRSNVRVARVHALLFSKPTTYQHMLNELSWLDARVLLSRVTCKRHKYAQTLLVCLLICNPASIHSLTRRRPNARRHIDDEPDHHHHRTNPDHRTARQLNVRGARSGVGWQTFTARRVAMLLRGVLRNIHVALLLYVYRQNGRLRNFCRITIRADPQPARTRARARGGIAT